MSLVINTNVGALNAQRQLVSSGSELSQAMERLSSGRRINSAADDAAGLAISNRQTSQIRGLDQAIRNANDGVSLIQTAEGALDESTNILQRMRELSIQSANGIYSDADRATLDAEFQQLIEELDRIAETTSFNGQNLLDGTLGDVALHIGSEADQIIDFSIQGMSTSDLGLGATSSDLNGGRVETGIGSSIGEGDVLINNQALSAITDLGGTGTDDTTLFDVIDDINTNIEGVSASGYNIVAAESAGSGIISASETLRLTLGSIDDQAEVVYDITNTESMDDLVETINQITGGNITAALDDNGKLSLSNVTGGTITVSYDDESPYIAADAILGDTAIETITGISVGADGDGTESFNGSIALTADDGSTITITRGAGGTSADLSVLGFPEVTGAGEVLGVSLDSGGQNNPLASGDLIINGTNIGAIPEDEGLQAKLDAINALSDETGVTATSLAIDALTTKTTDDYTELTAAVGDFPVGDININGVNVATTGTSVEETVTEINAETSNTGVSAFVDNAGSIHLFSEGQITLSDGTGGDITEFGTFTQLDNTTQAGEGTYSVDVLSSGVTPSKGSVSINGTNVTLTDISSVDTMVTEINAASGSTGVRALIDDNGELQLSSPSRINVQLGSADNALTSLSALGITLEDLASTPNDLSDDAYVIDPAIKLDSANDATISIEVTADGTDATGLQSLNTDLSSTIVGSALASLSIGTAEGANAAIGSIDQALETINATRSDLGAINNRLEFTMSNLSNISENTSAARSRIVDADFAAESANLSRAQVLQQASQAMLAQANAQPQQVLQLLQG